MCIFKVIYFDVFVAGLRHAANLRAWTLYLEMLSYLYCKLTSVLRGSVLPVRRAVNNDGFTSSFSVLVRFIYVFLVLLCWSGPPAQCCIQMHALSCSDFKGTISGMSS
jgi:hypothetical protein